MRAAAIVLFLALVVICYACGHINARSKTAPNSSSVSAANLVSEPAKAETATARVDFATQIKPIFEARCQPCHFSGGKVYAQMPFDRPETIKNLGSKLFTRIKDENERRVIRDFLAQE
jgi:cytochrome c5